ncbi:unnamed protein product [Closterium sp. Yama58-4]|nr:unnamed protein product [Closterium sp. Yama58-4]
MKEATGKFSSVPLCHRVNGHIHLKLANMIEDASTKLRHLRTALESALKATELSPNSVEYSHFYAQLLFEAADGRDYSEVLRECERGLGIESPVDPAKESLQEESQQELATPAERVTHVQNELRGLQQEANIAAFKNIWRSFGNGADERFKVMQSCKVRGEEDLRQPLRAALIAAAAPHPQDAGGAPSGDRGAGHCRAPAAGAGAGAGAGAAADGSGAGASASASDAAPGCASSSAEEENAGVKDAGGGKRRGGQDGAKLLGEVLAGRLEAGAQLAIEGKVEKALGQEEKSKILEIQKADVCDGLARGGGEGETEGEREGAEEGAREGAEEGAEKIVGVGVEEGGVDIEKRVAAALGETKGGSEEEKKGIIIWDFGLSKETDEEEGEVEGKEVGCGRDGEDEEEEEEEEEEEDEEEEVEEVCDNKSGAEEGWMAQEGDPSRIELQEDDKERTSEHEVARMQDEQRS